MHISSNLSSFKDKNNQINFGNRKIPRFLYHLTNEENYRFMLNEGKIRIDKNYHSLQGVYMIELSNFLKRWGISSDWNGDNLRRKLLQQASNTHNSKIVLLKIPTANINKEKLVVRSQNSFFRVLYNGLSIKDLKPGKTTRKSPDVVFRHTLFGDPAINAKSYKQRKEAIEYIYPDEILISDVQKIGEAEINPKNVDKISLRFFFSKLLKGQPEQKAVALLKE